MAWLEVFSATGTMRLVLCMLLLAFHSLAFSADDLVTSQMVDEARLWQSKGRDDLASNVWRRILVTNPQHPEALINLGTIEVRAGRISEAQVLYQRAKRSSKTTPNLARLAELLDAAAPPVPPPSVDTRQSPSKFILPPVSPVDSVSAVKVERDLAATTASQPKAAKITSKNEAASRNTRSDKKTDKTTSAVTSPLPVAPPSMDVRVTALPFPPISATKIGERDIDSNEIELGLKATDTLKSRAVSPTSVVGANGPSTLRRPKPCRLPSVSGATTVAN